MEIINYWSDKLSSILDDFTFDPQKKYFTNSVQTSGAICLSRPRILARLRGPKSPHPRVPGDYLLIICMKKFRNGKTEERHVYHAIREKLRYHLRHPRRALDLKTKDLIGHL